jgi:hypothetical protein
VLNFRKIAAASRSRPEQASDGRCRRRECERSAPLMLDAAFWNRSFAKLETYSGRFK